MRASKQAATSTGTASTWLALLLPLLQLVHAQQQQQQRPLLAAHDDAEDTSTPIPIPSLPEPSGPLPWSELNILSTTDTHGWVRGHQTPSPPEDLYSADLGDLAAFKSHLQAIADEKGADLLFVDSGDQVDGNGFVDADIAGYKGHAARELLKLVGWDITTTGNHELYNHTVAGDVYRNFIPAFNGRYLASNVNITLPNSDVSGPASVSVPFGSRYSQFRTKNRGIRITAFGVIFNFNRPDEGLAVQAPKEMVKEEWWREVVQQNDTDVFLIVGHMGTSDPDWLVVLQSIRSYHPTTPVLIFSGHEHIRSCARPDPYTQILAAGRYLETLGFTSLSFPRCSTSLTLPFSGISDRPAPPHIARRYLDTNLATYQYHANLSSERFSTPLARGIKDRMAAYARSFNLSYTFGHAPQSYYLTRYPVSHPRSLIKLYTSEIVQSVLFPSALPSLLSSDTPAIREASEQGGRSAQPIFLFNTGSARFDLFEGPFTRDSQFAIVPFENAISSVPGLTLGLVRDLTTYLNHMSGEPEIAKRQLEDVYVAREERGNWRILSDAMAVTATRRREAAAFASYARRMAASRSVLSVAAVQDEENTETVQSHRRLTYGYVTHDHCGPDPGDDTPHRPVPYFEVPEFVLSDLIDGEKAMPRDTEDFIAPLVIHVLNTLQAHKTYGKQDIRLYSNLKANELLGEFARKEWN